MKRVVKVRAPSNIALVKYMGKLDYVSNLPANSSLSMTLNSLATFTQLEFIPGGSFQLSWEGITSWGATPLRSFCLRDHERIKVEKHFKRVLEYFGESYSGVWRIQSGNSFPAGAGIASSASGFAALTLAIVTALRLKDIPCSVLSELSRQGSGSSCRSFEGPWVLWEGESARRVQSNFEPLSDLVLMIEESEKLVGSSEAHRRILSSRNWQGRVERANSRVTRLQEILLRGDWGEFSSLSWQEAMDMHELFHTSEPSFSYFKSGTREVLSWLESLKDIRSAVTLDAGPNIHLLVSQSEEAVWIERLRERFPKMNVLIDRQGEGASVLYQAEVPA